MRCILTGSSNMDAEGVLKVLSRLEVQVFRADRYHGDWLTGRIVHDVDFLCAVLGSEDQGVPPAIYLDIGVALGREVPVLLVMPPGARTPLAISGLPRIDASLDNQEALQLHLEDFIESLRTPTVQQHEVVGRGLSDEQYVSLGGELEEIISGFQDREFPVDNTKSWKNSSVRYS